MATLKKIKVKRKKWVKWDEWLGGLYLKGWKYLKQVSILIFKVKGLKKLIRAVCFVWGIWFIITLKLLFSFKCFVEMKGVKNIKDFVFWVN